MISDCDGDGAEWAKNIDHPVLLKKEK